MPHPKVLGFRARYFAVAYGIFFIYNFENVIFHFWPLPEKLLDRPKKKQLFCPTHTPMFRFLRWPHRSVNHRSRVRLCTHCLCRAA